MSSQLNSCVVHTRHNDDTTVSMLFKHEKGCYSLVSSEFYWRLYSYKTEDASQGDSEQKVTFRV